MDLSLTDEQISELKIKFQAWQELQERRKELQEENKALCQDAARVFSGKQSDANKLFKNLSQLYDGEDAEANNISILLDAISKVS